MSTGHTVIAATLLGLGGVWSATATAADPEPEPAAGVVTVQTVTIAGHDFSQYFLAAWRDKEGSEHYTLSINERPSARLGSEVWIGLRNGACFKPACHRPAPPSAR